MGTAGKAASPQEARRSRDRSLPGKRLTITQERFLQIHGVVQKVDRVIHVKAERIEARPAPVARASDSHDFH
jgi:hypothetical protein